MPDAKPLVQSWFSSEIPAKVSSNNYFREPNQILRTVDWEQIV